MSHSHKKVSHLSGFSLIFCVFLHLSKTSICCLKTQNQNLSHFLFSSITPYSPDYKNYLSIFCLLLIFKTSNCHTSGARRSPLLHNHKSQNFRGLTANLFSFQSPNTFCQKNLEGKNVTIVERRWLPRWKFRAHATHFLTGRRSSTD